MPLIINGEPIDDAIVEQEFINIKSAYERLDPNVQCCERDPEFRGYAQDNITARVLLAQEARETIDPIPADEVHDAIDKLKQEHGGEEQFYAAFNITAEQDDIVYQDVELNLRVQKLLDSATGPAPDPTDAQLRQYYDDHIEDFMNPEQVRASHILKAPQRGEDREDTYDQLRTLRQQLLNGADFNQLAREHSDKAREIQDAPDDKKLSDPDDDGIDLGHFTRGQLMEEFEVVAFSMRPGEISPVFTTPFGFHLIQLTDHTPATPKPFDEVREEVKLAHNEDARNEKTQTYVNKLKAKASIETTDQTANSI